MHIIERQSICCFFVHLGFNFDCSVIFVNGDSGFIEFFSGQAFIEFETVGPVERTECRIEEGDINGPFSDCKFKVHWLN